MKYLYFIPVVIFCCLHTYAWGQCYGYSLATRSNEPGSTSEELGFCIDSSYYELTQRTTMRSGWCAQIVDRTLSSGSVTRYKHTLILHDVIAGYNMKVRATDTSLRVIDGFEWFKDIVFSGDGIKWEKDRRIDSITINYPEDCLKRPTIMDSLLFIVGKSMDTGNQYEFMNGTYGPAYQYKTTGSSPAIDSTTRHIVFDGNTYTYKIGPMVLTRGYWRRMGNYVLFKDETLNAYFIGELSGNNRLTTKVFPLVDISMQLTLY